MRWSAALDTLDGVLDGLAALPPDTLTHPQLMEVLGRLERVRRRLPAVEHRLIGRLAAEASPVQLGGKNLAEVLATGLRISSRDARLRIDEAADLGGRTALDGQPLPPLLENTASAQARGEAGAEQVQIIRKFLGQLPDAVDYDTREAAEATLARLATGLRPEHLQKAADRLLALLHPDGDLPSDTDRARRRYLSIGRQQADGMSEVHGLLDPEARATLDAVLAKHAAPGMANPDDETPCIDGQPSEQAVRADLRTQPQRNHDALKAIARSVLASGELGQHNGLPVTVIVSTTLQDLQAAAGQAVTGSGTQLPMTDVIRMSTHAYHYLTVFDTHTAIPLYLGRSRRTASPGQRIVLHARDRGCTFPGCTVPGYGCQAHHSQCDWANGGDTNVDDLTLACGPHNRLVTPGGWTTRKRRDGRTEWIPPPHLDWGQSRVNDFHHPENYLTSDDDDAA